ncbi:MAG: alpha/beta fold hydrolase [Verrucomicrobiota bacterium]|nr:alpha/beta fold hydrolase [Verrucomicrobiota bacterium]
MMKRAALSLTAFLLYLVSLSAAETIETLAARFFKSAQYRDAELAPGGKYLSYASLINNKYALEVYDFAADSRRAIASKAGDDYSLSNIYWIDSSTLLYEVTDAWKVYAGASVVDVDLKKPKPIENDQERSSYNIVDTLPFVDNECLVTVIDWERGGQEFPDLCRLNVKSRSYYRVVVNPGNVVGWMADKSGVIRLAFAKEAGGSRVALYRVTDGDPWMPLPLPGNSTVMNFDPTGKFLMIATTEEENDLYGLATWDLQKMKVMGRVFRDPPYDVGAAEATESFQDTTTGNVVGIKYHTDKPKYIWFDARYREVARAVNIAFPDKANEILGFINEGREAIIESYSDRDPPGIFRLNLETGVMEAMISAHPDIKPENMATMKPVEFKAADGETIHGYLTLPTENSTSLPPLIALVHGGPTVRDTWGYDSEVQYFAALGYAVLQVNYRGSVGYGLKHKGRTWARPVNYVIHDVADGVKWAIQQQLVNPDKVAIYGWSFGGYAALAGAENYPDLYKAAIGSAGIYDWKAFYKSDKSDKRSFIDLIYGGDAEDLEKMTEYSPIKAAAKIKCPVMLFHGSSDRRVPSSQSEAMASALRKAGVRHKLITNSWVGHGFYDPKKRVKYYIELGKFLKETLEK